MTGSTDMNTGEDGIERVLTQWAQADRDPEVAPGAALAAANRALDTARQEELPVAANDRRWWPASLAAGGVAAAVAGVIFMTGSPGGAPAPVASVSVAPPELASVEPVAPVPAMQLAEAPTPIESRENLDAAPPSIEEPVALAAAEQAGPAPAPFGAARRLPAGERLATADMTDFDFTEANDDLLMTGYVFTPRPEEELLP